MSSSWPHVFISLVYFVCLVEFPRCPRALRNSPKISGLNIRLYLSVPGTFWEDSPASLQSPGPVPTVLPGKTQRKIFFTLQYQKDFSLEKDCLFSEFFFPPDGPCKIVVDCVSVCVCWSLRAEGGHLLLLYCPKLTIPCHLVYLFYSSVIIISSPCSLSLCCHLSKNVFYESLKFIHANFSCIFKNNFIEM